MKKKVSGFLAFVLMVSLLAGVALQPVSAVSTDAPVVSCGLLILSARTDVSLSAMVGNDIPFSADDFAKGLNLSKVDFITVKSIPENTDGELLLGSSRIAAGQTVSAANLLAVCFHPYREDVRKASFTFTANGSTVPMLCNLFLLEKQNASPTVALASSLTLSNSTYRGIPLYGTLAAHDPDGDRIRFEIVRYPQNGSVQMADAEAGTYVYQPNHKYVGTDQFSYVVRDLYGNYSGTATVSLKVEIPGTSVYYSDVEDTRQALAIRVTEKGIMSGTKVGGQDLFYPDKTVSRAEFVVMAMNAAGITDLPAKTGTVFADDAEIPDAMKGYIAAAYDLGYISGTQKNGVLCFLPNEEISRAEAAVILCRMLSVEDASVIPTFADTSEIPTWAKDAVYSLNAIGMMNASDGYISPTASVTRAEAAELLCAVLRFGK